MFQILRLIFVSRNGLSEGELFDLVPTLTWNYWVPLYDVLVERHILTHRSGLLVCAHEQVGNGLPVWHILMKRTQPEHFRQWSGLAVCGHKQEGNGLAFWCALMNSHIMIWCLLMRR